MKYIHLLYILVITFVFTLSSCVDERVYVDPEIGEGSGTIRATVEFRNLEPVVMSRTAGNAVDEIHSLWVVMYRIIPSSSDTDTETLAYVGKYHVSEGTEYGYKVEQIKNSEPEDVENGPNLGATAQYTSHATFRLTDIPYGRYKLYAVANVDLTDVDCTTEESLRSQYFEWIPVDTEADNQEFKNTQMFGYFTPATAQTSQGFDAPAITVNRKTTDVHSWVKRLVSKVTVAYDGSGLKEGISIQLNSVAIKRIPRYCYLGENNTVSENWTYFTDGEQIEYPDAPVVSKTTPFYPAKTAGTSEEPEWDKDNGPHSNSANALYFFENMQGTGPDKQQKRDDKDELIEYDFSQMPYATYIEVDAVWEATAPNEPAVGTIKYRFMLGKNITDNYDAVRNFHYKLTLHFNGTANDYDWRIDLEKFLSVPDPHEVDYQGYFFTINWSINNLGNNFSRDNDIIVESFEKNIQEDTKTFLPLTITYDVNGDGKFEDQRPSWLKEPEQEDITGEPLQKKIKFRYTCQPTETYTIQEKVFGSDDNPVTAVGSETSPKNLAGENDGDMTNTANCYIIGTKGYYILPLVYGNARTDGEDYDDSYKNFTGEDRVLGNLVNYKNTGISSPYILTDIYGENIFETTKEKISASLVWEDVDGLIGDLKYDKDAYGGKGGIKFSVLTPCNGGNAVIAIKDADGTIMWSWHIWVTYDKFYDELAQTLYQNEVAKYDIIPVNLGWCPGEDGDIKYFEHHECKVKISNGIYSRVINIVQHEHLATPLGNYTYFQWGRKDPFPGSTGNPSSDSQNVLVAKNKTWWHYDGDGEWVGNENSPIVINPDFSNEAHRSRKFTREILDILIQNPAKWNNPRCAGESPNWTSNDEIYSNLWTNDIKTVYDPCPVGYQVSPCSPEDGYGTYYGFVNGNAWVADAWFNVLPNRMLDGYRDNIVEFYTDFTKMISSTFVEAGYRDYDYNGSVLSYDKGHVWYAKNLNNNNSYYFYYWIKDPDYEKGTFSDPIAPENGDSFSSSLIAPAWYAFYPCDGFAVRPTKKL